MDAEFESVPVIRTKLHRPPVTADLVRRDRLFELMEGALQASLTLVSAPAGYGKSVLVAQWADVHEHPCAWLSLDEDDSDLRSFLLYVVATIGTVSAGACHATRELLNAPTLPPVPVLAGHLINELDALDLSCVLVLDDYHRIRHESPVHELMKWLIEQHPRHIHLVLITRRDPPLPLSSLLAGNRVSEVRLQDLRFTPPEMREFLAAAAELEVGEEALANLLRQIEGWAVGLRLVSLALRHAADPDAFLRGLAGGIPHTQEYLLQEVLAAQSPEVRGCLLRSSILDRFSPDVLEAVCASDLEAAPPGLEGREFVALLQRGNVFTIPLDGRGDWFRYHHLFQELLQRQLRQDMSSEEVASLHSRAAEWFEGENLIDEALKHALAADDVEGAAQIVERNRQAALNTDQMYLLEKWLSRLPEPVVQQRAGLLLARTWVFHHQLRVGAILPILDQVESLLRDDPGHQSLRGEVAFFRGYLHFFLDDGALGLKHLEQVLESIPESYHEVRAQTEIFLGLARQMEGQKDRAVALVDELLDSQPPPVDLIRTRLLATCVYLHIISGDLAESEPYNRRFRTAVKGGNYPYAEAWSDYLPGLVHLYRHELDAAIPLLRRSVEQRFVHHVRAAVDSLVGLMLAMEAAGRPDEAQAAQRLLREYVAPLDDPAYSALADSCDVRLAILQGRPERAVRWLETSPPPPPEVMIWWLEVPCVTRCRALIAEGSSAGLGEAEERLREYAELNERHHNTCQLIGILALQTMACERHGKTQKALAFLGRAVKLARPGGFIFPFVEAGPSMAGMLEQLLEESDEADFIRRVLIAISNTPTAVSAAALRARAVARSVAGGSSVPSVPGRLTNRELEVLELLAQRLQSKEIAARMCISAQTVSFHLKNIYRKLGVHSRRQAVDRAVQAGILAHR